MFPPSDYVSKIKVNLNRQNLVSHIFGEEMGQITSTPLQCSKCRNNWVLAIDFRLFGRSGACIRLLHSASPGRWTYISNEVVESCSGPASGWQKIS